MENHKFLILLLILHQNFQLNLMIVEVLFKYQIEMKFIYVVQKKIEKIIKYFVFYILIIILVYVVKMTQFQQLFYLLNIMDKNIFGNWLMINLGVFLMQEIGNFYL